MTGLVHHLVRRGHIRPRLHRLSSSAEKQRKPALLRDTSHLLPVTLISWRRGARILFLAVLCGTSLGPFPGCFLSCGCRILSLVVSDSFEHHSLEAAAVAVAEVNGIPPAHGCIRLHFLLWDVSASTSISLLVNGINLHHLHLHSWQASKNQDRTNRKLFIAAPWHWRSIFATRFSSSRRCDVYGMNGAKSFI